nr:RHS repeat-associated core domain-containing protein [Methylomarinum sp. Ch1-1]MDP4520512.1 RHS repeat-associated core domain-containing protein [Methylomarinum sp. Ch1-1]
MKAQHFCQGLFVLFFGLYLAACTPSATRVNSPNTVSIVQPVVVPGFDEPLIYLNAATADLIPLVKPETRPGATDLERLSQYQRLNRNTPWAASIQLNLGLAYYRNGYFSQTFAAFEKAWTLSKDHKESEAKALADRAFSELIRMHARLGHADRVESLLASVKGRAFTGPATAAVAGAEEGLWMMRNHPGVTYLCGPKALYSVLKWQQPDAEGLQVLDAYRSGVNGVNLLELGQLAEQAHMPYRTVYRNAGQSIPVPSVIHWNVNHYAAIVEKQGDLYHIQDPTFGQDLWFSADAINAQASGYFLVPDSGIELGADWQPVTIAQAESVYGQGYTASSDPNRTTTCDVKKSKQPCNSIDQPDGKVGMAYYDVHTMLVSLNITDTPIRYTPALGAPIRFTFTYNQREANQPANFTFGNLGPKWTHNWLTYIQDVPTNPSAVVNRIAAGGGAVDYANYNAATGEFQKGVSDNARLYRISADPIVYERRLSNGAKEIYSFSDGAVSGVRRVFLTQKIDPQGHAVQLTYDAQLRLTGITDALGQTTVLSYEHFANTKLITRVTDPFGREAIIDYDNNGRLASITDPVGIVSAFGYDSGDFINVMTTPYGDTRFAYSGNGTSRTLIVTDPYGEQERIEYGQSLGIPRYVSDQPRGDIKTLNNYHHYRNTAYWDKQTYKDYGRNLSKAEVSHWLHTPDSKTSGLLETFKKPLEHRVWFNYPGQTSAITEHNIYQENPSRLGRVLDDGSSQIFIREFNAFGKPTLEKSPLGHVTRYLYADNQIDPVKIVKWRNGSEETVAEFEWNDHHNLVRATDGLGHSTTFTYNAAGQILTRRNALGHVTRYEYDALGYRVKVSYPSGKTEQYAYDDSGRVVAYTDTGGHTRTQAYDDLNRLLSVSYDDGTAVEYTWDKLDLVKIRDRLGRETHYTYDALRRKISEKDHLGRETTYAYDASDRLLSVTDPLDQTTHYEYDIQGRKTAMIDAEGHKTRYVYEQSTSRLARVIDADQGASDFDYDRSNRLVAVTDPNGHATQYLLDEVGNTLQTDSPDSGLTAYTYNVLGQAVQKTDARGSVSQYHYDALNRLTEVNYADSGYDLRWYYDGDNYGDSVSTELRQTALGKRTGMSDPTGQTQWLYNRYGDIERQDTGLSALGGKTFSQQFAYDYRYEPGQGLLTQHVYPNGQVFDFQYDNHGRVESIGSTAGGGKTPVVSGVSYHPVAADGIAAFQYGNGIHYQRQVDGLGRLTELNLSGQQTVFHRQWQYTPASDVAAIGDLLDPLQNRTYQYDALHRLSQAAGPFPNAYQYDANGNRTVRNSENYGIDAHSNRLQSISDSGLNTALSYDAAGNLIEKTAGSAGYAYQYDPHNRLASIAGGQGQIASYQYNGLGQRVVKQSAEGAEYSLYDLQGRRIAQLSGSGELLHNTLYWQGQPLAQYRTDREGVYRFLSKQPHRDAELSVDINTRRIRLLRIDGSLLDTVIDAALWQIDITGEGAVYHFAIGQGANQELKGWIRLPDDGKGFAHIMDKTQGHPQEYRLDESERSLNAYYYHLDHIGTPQVITDQAQNIVWQASYAPFGQTAITTETIDNDLRFPGQYYDRESGLYYNWNRYYDPATGRYITSDPIGLDGGINTYAYAGGIRLIGRILMG